MFKKQLQIILLTFLIHTGVYGQSYALDFDGTNDYATTPIDADLQAMPSTTWSGWIKPTSVSGYQIIFGMEDGGWDRMLLIEPGGGLSLGHTNNRWQTGVSVVTGAWQHVAVVYDNGAMRFYFNGTAYATTTNEGNHSSAGTFTIGGNQSPGGNYYRGLIDEVAVWNEALTAAEITTLYNSGIGLDAASNSGNYASASNLVGYYKMNEGTGTTLVDASGNVNTATLSNMDAADWVTGVSMVAVINPFVTTWQTDASTNVTIPLTGSGYDFSIDWGDGTIETKTGSPGNISHTYATAGVKTVSITPNITTGFPRIYVNDFANKDLLLTVESWGSGIWGASVNSSFYGASNLEVNATDTPNFSETIDLAAMFYGCSALTGANGFANWTLNTDVPASINFARMFQLCPLFNGAISTWNVSGVSIMSAMFQQTQNINQDLSAWDVSNVQNMSYMFLGSNYSEPLIWGVKTGNVTNMAGMFQSNTAFNQDLSSWDVSSVVDMANMFIYANSFNQNISGWDVSSVTDFSDMFSGAINFSQDISSWNVGSATSMASMFSNADAFNIDISSWDVSSVTTMNHMFAYTAIFNQNLNTWDVSSVLDFNQMFKGAGGFNTDISDWNFTTDPSKSITMSYMFQASSFNKNINAWNVERVTSMEGMFRQNDNFDQDISNWDISSVTNLTDFLLGGELSSANYNALLLGWSTLDAGETLIPLNLNAHFGGSIYSNQPAVITARDTDLIASKNWTITDGGMFDSTVFTPTTITGTTTICAGDSTTLTASGGATNANTVDVWYEGACGGEAYHNGWDALPNTTNSSTVNSVSNGILNVTSTSNDPMIFMFSLGAFDPFIYKYMNVRYKVVSGTAGETEMFFTNNTYTDASGFARVDGSLISDGNWHTLSIDMSTHADWTTGGNITGWRYDYATNSGVTMELDFIELSSQPILATGTTVTVSPTTNTTYYVNRKGPETNTSCISQLVTVNQIPVMTNFNNYSKTYFDGSFTIANPTSTSAGAFTYSSDNTGVATISGNTVTITGIGVATITATQAANGSFCSNSASVSLTVNSLALTDKYGKISTTNVNYINSNGAISTDVGVNKYGAVLKAKSPFSGGTFAGFTYNLVTSATGKVWLDRNLGATQVATSSTDAASFGDLYQWGRGTDGHEKRTSTNISTVSTTDTPGHSFFINANSFNWQSPVNTNLWQGVNGTNNPCPNGFRVPTIEELEAERDSWGSQNAAGAIASSLKLPLAGRRHTNGGIYSVGSNGMYRTTTSFILNITSAIAARAGDERIDGFCVRCIKD